MNRALPTVSSLQCVGALYLLGFAIAASDARVVTLVGHDGRRVFVRRHCMLAPGELRAILIVAGVGDDAFLGALARRGSGTTRIAGADDEADATKRARERR